MPRKYPIGIQSFEDLRINNYVYVDKTRFVYELADIGKSYFYSRPRRFGKSLLLSTMQAYFEGKRELFEGLAIEQLESNWFRYPVLHLDLNAERYETVEDLNEIIDRHLSIWEDLYGRDARESSLASRFSGVIRRAKEKTGRNVVVLVDEYDKPLQQVMHNETVFAEYRAIFKGFFGVLKSSDSNLKFSFLTGVTKFGKVSVFSDLNNLKDITMDGRYQSMCGITEAELLRDFPEDIKRLGEANDLDYEQTCQKLKFWYDGYHFCEDGEDMYNPFSLLNTLDRGKFKDYWFVTGTPTFLVRMLKTGKYNALDINKVEMMGSDLSKVTVDSGNPIQILYQSGYLTIKSYDARRDWYQLGFPNEEVKKGFYNCLAPIFLEVPNNSLNVYSDRISRSIYNEDLDLLMQTIQEFLPEIPYFFHSNQKSPERHFQEIFYILLLSAGLTSRVEEYTSQGRSDIVTEIDTAVFVFELKIDKPAEDAIRQILDKGYIERYRSGGKRLYAIGVSFDYGKRLVNEWKVQEC